MSTASRANAVRWADRVNRLEALVQGTLDDVSPDEEPTLIRAVPPRPTEARSASKSQLLRKLPRQEFRPFAAAELAELDDVTDEVNTDPEQTRVTDVPSVRRLPNSSLRKRTYGELPVPASVRALPAVTVRPVAAPPAPAPPPSIDPRVVCNQRVLPHGSLDNMHTRLLSLSPAFHAALKQIAPKKRYATTRFVLIVGLMLGFLALGATPAGRQLVVGEAHGVAVGASRALEMVR